NARVDAARRGELARDAHARARVGRDILGRVERLHRHVGDGREADVALLLRPVALLEPLAPGHRSRLRGRSGTTRAGFARRRRSTIFRATGSQCSGTRTWTRDPNAMDG